MDYWHQCIQGAFKDVGLIASHEQISGVVVWVEDAHENYSKINCPECKGNGRIIRYGLGHSIESQCQKCNWEG